ncbi:MAG TPA: zinc ribbon domain-containing protein [Methanobacterium sp.]|nr:zinc ribbon domain-containing protein [Methanobacterium sp.]
MGFLICDNCGGYYELQEGERPEDFQSCECGGNLKYVEKSDSSINKIPDNKSKNDSVLFIVLGSLFLFSIFFISLRNTSLFFITGFEILFIIIVLFIIPIIAGFIFGETYRKGLLAGLLLGISLSLLQITALESSHGFDITIIHLNYLILFLTIIDVLMGIFGVWIGIWLQKRMPEQHKRLINKAEIFISDFTEKILNNSSKNKNKLKNDDLNKDEKNKGHSNGPKLMCQNCGIENEDHADFCMNCGKRLQRAVIKKKPLNKHYVSNKKLNNWWNKQNIGSKAVIGIFCIICLVLIVNIGLWETSYIPYGYDNGTYYSSEYLSFSYDSWNYAIHGNKVTDDDLLLKAEYSEGVNFTLQKRSDLESADEAVTQHKAILDENVKGSRTVYTIEPIEIGGVTGYKFDVRGYYPDFSERNFIIIYFEKEGIVYQINFDYNDEERIIQQEKMDKILNSLKFTE